MKITMLSTHRGTEDGHSLKYYERGQEYEVSRTLASSFISRGWAVESKYYEANND